WKINEKPETWSIKDDALWAHGVRSHIFYTGPENNFTNFEFHAEVLTHTNSNGGIFIHTKFQEDGWPVKGFECQVNNTFVKDPIKTASVYKIKNILDAPAKDNEWFNYDIIVKGKTITIKINDKVVNEYTEPAGKTADKNMQNILDSGTFALQGHDPGSVVGYRNIRVKRLP
ncbi:MAG: hypothetical protein JWM04_2344, partial [Verrucomicrobiales bacterium]|nr:hypothetical protein [Verrucomicrobiales bacterium]